MLTIILMRFMMMTGAAEGTTLEMITDEMTLFTNSCVCGGWMGGTGAALLTCCWMTIG